GQTGQVPITFGGFTGTSEVLGPRKRGTGYNLELPAYENDVLNALTRSGGLPGLDARNEVIIYRTPERGAGRDPTPMQWPQQCLPFSLDGLPGMDGNMRVLRIPLRLPSGTPIPFQPEDIVLRTGDIVFVPSRDAEVFYTGGLLVSGQYPLPRDYDLDVVAA